MQNLNAFQAQQQALYLDTLQSDPNLTIYRNSSVPLVFGNPFTTNFGQLDILFNNHAIDEQMSLGVDL